MANVLFRRGTQTYIDNNVPLVDGQVIFNETDQAIYLDSADSGTLTRTRYGGGNLSRSDVDATLSTSSINPIQNQAVANAIGNLSSLDTTNKSSLVGAVNEVNTKVSKTEVLISNSGDAYSTSKAYAVGDLVIYNNTLYRCITACSAGSWATNQSCFVQDTLVNIITANSSKINTMDELISVTFTPVAMRNSLILTRYGKIILSPQDVLMTKVGTYSGSQVVNVDGHQYPVLGSCSYNDAVKLVKKDIPYDSSIKLCLGNIGGARIYFYLYNYHNSAVSLYSSSFETTISNISTCFLIPSVA